ncbi:MAG: cobalamin-dependent protein [Thermoproteota archaeon]|nr:cobalamin-dependent protein [Thermoproteota archaeon]
MAFIRVKTIKKIDYLYLVQSKWDSLRKTSTQQTIKYLGKASDVTIESIPQVYRNNPRILSTLRSKTKNHSKKNLIIEELKKQVFNALKNGEVEKVLLIAEIYEKETSLSDFYDDILKQVLYEIGYLWEQNKLDIATEHICSNITNEIIYKINKSHIKNNKKSNILLCNPDGEIHNIGCNIIGSILLQKGYTVHNISPSSPTESILNYIKQTNPSLIMISVTLKDNIESSKRLIKKISTESDIPILLGGLAITESSEMEKKDIELITTNVKIITNTTLETLVRIVGRILTKNTTINQMLVQRVV